MNSKYRFVVFFAISLLPLIAVRASAKCSRSCGRGQKLKPLPFPFGFSSECPIHLNCRAKGEIFIGEFPVLSVSSDRILIGLRAKCDRSIDSLGHLFTKNFAPTSRNGIILQNCAAPLLPCTLLTTMARTELDISCDSAAKNISCYSGSSGNGFINYKNLTSGSCRVLLSAISVESWNSSAVWLEVQAVELGWWMEGECRCSDPTANCTHLVSPFNGKPGYRCQCKEGFEGDGYRDGVGCRKVSSACNPSKYMSGQCGGTARIGVLIGAITAGACFMATLILICCFIRRQLSLKAKNNTKRRLSEATGGNCSIPIYAYKDIARATNSFADKQRLGTGAYGTVYSGKLGNNEWVAIKRIRRRDTDSIEQVMNEIKLVSSVNHPNLVRLLGCSMEKGEQILVYEFMPNGTLSQHLQRERGEGLAWPIRLTIAAETAGAIAHLHSASPPIFHRDIKSTNILLDCNFKSKVADFGLSRLGMTELSYISTAPQGTPGYVDPQYHQNFQLSDRSDVYSFGVVLVEIITALKAVDFSRPHNEVNLAALATDRIGKGCLDEIIDPFLEPHRDACTLSSVLKVAELAFRCLAFHKDMRPSMVEVADELEQIRMSRSWVTVASCCTASPAETSSYCSSSSNASEKPLSVAVKKVGLESRGLYALQSGIVSVNSMERVKDNSPVSVQDPWSSEQSSPSSNSLLGHVIQ